MIYIGIDISKDLNVISGIHTPEKPDFSGAKFSNDHIGFVEFLNFLQGQNYFPNDVTLCLESTGVYGERFCQFFYQAGYAVHVEPPQHVRRAFRLKRKTDKVDSRMIAEYAFRFRDQLHLWTPKDEIIEQIRTLLNNREMFQKERTAHKNMLNALKQKNIITLEHSHVYAIDFLHDQIQAIDTKLQHYIRQAEDTDTQIGFEMLLTIPGVGWQWAACFFVVSNGFHQLNYRKLAAYLGLVPYEYESGSSVYRNPKTDRSGPDQFRKLLYLSAISVCRIGKFQKYFQQKKAEGKNGKLILNNIQNKLLKIACACVREKKPYHEGHRSLNPLNDSAK